MNENQLSESSGTGAVNAMEPINLRKRFGDKFKIAFDEAYVAEYGPNARIDDPWLQLVPGKLGHVFPFGGEMLAVSTNSRGPTANRLAKLPFCDVVLDGDDGMTFVFHADHFLQVAKIIGARSTRRLSDDRRAAFIAAGKAHRFCSRKMGPSSSL